MVDSKGIGREKGQECMLCGERCREKIYECREGCNSVMILFDDANVRSAGAAHTCSGALAFVLHTVENSIRVV